MVTRAHFPLPKCKAVGIYGSLLTRSAGDVVEASNAQVLPCLSFEGVRVRGYGGKLVLEKAVFVYFLRRRKLV